MRRILFAAAFASVALAIAATSASAADLSRAPPDAAQAIEHNTTIDRAVPASKAADRSTNNVYIIRHDDSAPAPLAPDLVLFDLGMTSPVFGFTDQASAGADAGRAIANDVFTGGSG